MPGLNILIVGAGICGPALATLLLRADPTHTITIIERWPSLREAGQQIDLQGSGLRVLKRMGLLGTMLSHCVAEEGVEIIDTKGRRLALFGVSPDGERRMTLTNEFEIMRGDVVRVLYEASMAQDARARAQNGNNRAGLVYEFNKTITELVQHFDGAGKGRRGGVDVTFSDGTAASYDLVVGADGLGSRTRNLAFGRAASTAAVHSIGVQAAYFSIPSVEGEDNIAKVYCARGRRLVVTRTNGRPTTHVILLTADDDDGRLKACYKQPTASQKEAFAAKFQGAGWETERLLEGMAKCDDFYAVDIAQVKLEKLVKGRVALLGDAGYCPSPFTGMGTNGGLLGAYVLAGELALASKKAQAARDGAGSNIDVESALETYSQRMQAPLKEMQRLPGTSATHLLFPSSRLGVWVWQIFAWATGWLLEWWYYFLGGSTHSASWSSLPSAREDKEKRMRIENKKKAEAMDERLGWDLPEYPELNLKG